MPRGRRFERANLLHVPSQRFCRLTNLRSGFRHATGGVGEEITGLVLGVFRNKTMTGGGWNPAGNAVGGIKSRLRWGRGGRQVSAKPREQTGEIGRRECCCEAGH